MQRRNEKQKLQKEIDYYELGDSISRMHIPEGLAEIELIQDGVNRLTAVVAERRRKLMENVFWENVVI